MSNHEGRKCQPTAEGFELLGLQSALRCNVRFSRKAKQGLQGNAPRWLWKARFGFWVATKGSKKAYRYPAIDDDGKRMTAAPPNVRFALHCSRIAAAFVRTRAVRSNTFSSKCSDTCCLLEHSSHLLGDPLLPFASPVPPISMPLAPGLLRRG